MFVSKRLFLPIFAGLVGGIVLTSFYFGIVSWAETPEHAIQQFWQDRWIVFPNIFGFGIQVALYVILKFQLYLPVAMPKPSGHLMGAGGTA